MVPNPRVIVRMKQVDSCKAHNSEPNTQQALTQAFSLPLLCGPGHCILKLCKTILSIFQCFYKCGRSQQPEAAKSHQPAMVHTPHESDKSVTKEIFKQFR